MAGIENAGNIGKSTENIYPKERRFNPEAVKDLVRERYYIARLRNIRMENIEKQGRNFGTLWQNDCREFMESRSRPWEVAIKLDKPIIKYSNYKTLDEHKKLIRKKFSSDVEGKIRGVEADFLPAQDLIDLQYIVLHEKTVNLFDIKNGVNPVKIRTSTLVYNEKDEALSLDVSSIHPTRGLSITQSSPHGASQYIFAPFILVPKKI